ncbi:protein FAM200C-like [Clavelina lepadiformis]|uniref:protein FAM200C-like n=1 Tax=Clavelina lepadiformis TaxID=159417 RepID=UPI0040426A43
MADDVLEQILIQVKKSPFYSIQLDESTDIEYLPQLSVFIRFINNEAVSEDKLLCKPLKLHTKGEDIFQLLDDFFTEYSIPWDKCAGICTDGAAACTGIKSGVVKRIKDKAPNAVWTHCLLQENCLKSCTKC